MTWPSSNLYRHLIASARNAAEPFHSTPKDHGALVERLASPSVVLIGEASHGTQDFYHLRNSIAKHLIEHHGLGAVAVEADWPDAYRVNRFVRGEGADGDANTALGGFSPNRTRGLRRTRRSITDRCSVAITRPGIFATRTWRTPSTR